MLQALPLRAKLVLREAADEEKDRPGRNFDCHDPGWLNPTLPVCAPGSARYLPEADDNPAFVPVRSAASAIGVNVAREDSTLAF